MALKQDLVGFYHYCNSGGRLLTGYSAGITIFINRMVVGKSDDKYSYYNDR